MNALAIKENRKKIGLTQEELAKSLGVSSRTILNWEQGGVIPKSKTELLRVFFETKLKEIENANSVSVKAPHEFEYIENKNSNKFMKLENGQYLMTMPLAEFNIQAGLLDHYQDIEFTKNMAKHSIIVDEPAKGRYLAFRVKGDSMDSGTSNGILPDSIVSTRELQRHLWRDKLRFKDFPYWVIYTTESRMPLLKEITEHNLENATIKCHSLNKDPGYNDFELSLNDVQALFYVVDISRQVSKRQNY